MKLTTTILILLVASLCGNFALWNNRKISTASEPVIKQAPTKKLSALVSRKDEKPEIESQLDKLRDAGLSKDRAFAVLVPELNQRLRERYMKNSAPRELARAGMQANQERRQLLRELSADDKFDENMFEPYRIRLRFDFEPPREDSGELKLRDSGRGESHSPDSNAPLPGDRGIHEVLSRIGGVDLSQDQKNQLVEIAQANHSNPDARATAIVDAFDSATAEQMIRCFEPGYQKAYQRATSVSDDPAERIRFANALHEYVQLRGKPQREARLLEALGADGIAIVRAANW